MKPVTPEIIRMSEKPPITRPLPKCPYFPEAQR